MFINSKFSSKIGWIASSMAIIMFLSYTDQIIRNIKGQKGSVLIPITSSINCTLWILYAISKKNIDKQILICNIVGLIISLISIITFII